MKAPHGQAAVYAFVGWDAFLRQHSHLKGEEFERAVAAEWEPRMVLVAAPPGRRFFYDKDVDGVEDPGEGSRGVRVHPMIADETTALLLDISRAHERGLAGVELWPYVSSCAGGYKFRLQKGSFDKLSCHGLGLAIDFDPKRNAYRKPVINTALGTMPGLDVVRAAERRGWKWGGDFFMPDAMHLQFATGF